MTRNRLRLSIYVGAALLAVGGGAVAAVAATAPTTKAAGGLTATFTKNSDWGTGYQGTYVIKNTGGAAVTGWQLAFGLPSSAKLGSTWEASVTTSGGVNTAKDKGYNATIPAGGTTEFGFIVVGKGDPTSCAINGASCTAGGSVPTTAPATKPATTAPTTSPTKPPTTAPTKPPTSAPATTTAPPPSNGGGGTVLVAPYVDMGLLSNGSTTLAQLASSSGVKSYSLAFVTGAGCKASWFGAFDPRTKQFGDQIKALRAAGGDVKVSFGGATGIELAQACTDVTALQAEYQAVVSAYDLKFIDLDIEGAASADTASIARRSTALAALQKANPGLKISLTLPVLPEGLTNDGLNVVKSAKNAGVDVDLVNIMAMDYGRSAQDYGDLAIQAVKSTKDQIKAIYGNSDAAAFKMVGVTPMLGKNDDQGTFNQSDARDLVAFANSNHVGFASFWELNRDKNACNGALFQCTNVPQSAFEFSKIFAGFRG
ncbi:cellulose binding domain-containing protein [Actinoplanes sp. NPDC051475]|uniref:cellulose binding domain-containing protein n=1 Tax=Actinoplanes sp. NPDC051475 TaxID=3157225 RepID=UPI00344CFFC6